MQRLFWRPAGSSGRRRSGPSQCYLSRNEVIEDSGVAAAVLGHPAQGVAWLVNAIAAQESVWNPGHWCSAVRLPALWQPEPETLLCQLR